MMLLKLEQQKFTFFKNEKLKRKKILMRNSEKWQKEQDTEQLIQIEWKVARQSQRETARRGIETKKKVKEKT